MRLRLRCSSAFSLGDYQWAMVHVPEHAHTVGDFAGHVSRLLELNLRGGDGELPQFLLDGFLVPHSEELRIVLRDDEVVDVERTDRITGLNAATAEVLGLSSGSKRALEAPKTCDTLALATSDAKRRKGGGPPSRGGGSVGKASTGVMALGWQPPEEGGATAASSSGRGRAVASAGKAVTATAASAPPKKAVAAPEESSSEESESEEAAPASKNGQDAKAAAAKAAAKKAAAAKAAAALDAAKQAALATCGKAAEAAEAAEAAQGSNATGTGDASAPGAVKSLFVGGLPQTVDDDTLRRHFARFGDIESASVVYNNHTGKPKGYGFVEFVDSSSAAKVLAEGKHQEISGKTVEVKPKQGKAGGKDGKDGKAGGKGGAKSGKSGKDGKVGNGKVAVGAKSAGKEHATPAEKIPPAAPAGKSAPVPRKIQVEESSSDEDEEDEAPPAKASAGKAPAKEPELTEEQRAMAALGLPVSFTCSQRAGADDSDDEEEEEEEEEDEE